LKHRELKSHGGDFGKYFSNYVPCTGYNKIYVFDGFLAHICLKIKAKAAKMHRFYNKTCAS
jgi:hypothetical protein